MSLQLNINSDKLVSLANKLEKTHKSALPVAVRQSLNDAAFEAKKKHVRKTFDKQFIVRKKGFIGSHTRVNKSKNTFNVNEMQSEMGVIKGKSEAGDELKYQELGGTIKDRDYIPLPGARVSQSQAKTVSKRHYLNRIEPQKNKPVFKQQNFIRAAFAAGEKGYLVFGEVLIQIRKIKKPSRNSVFIKAVPVYSYEKNRTIRLKPAPFIEPAGELAMKDIPKHFRERAKQRFQKYMNK
jgi:hypothetical protein